MDQVGIDWTVLDPPTGLAYGRATNIDWAIWTASAYNTWLYDAYLSQSDRFRGMALIPLQEPEAAVDELHRAVTELDMAGVHGGVHSGYGMHDINLWCVAHALGHPHGQLIALGAMVFNGIFDRFPGLRVRDYIIRHHPLLTTEAREALLGENATRLYARRTAPIGMLIS